LARQTRRASKLCCPECEYPFLDLELAYANHGVTVFDSKISTHLGEVRVSRTIQLAMIMLLECYPHVIRMQSLLALLEEHSISEDAEFPEKSIHVQISKCRKPLAQIGISFINIYAVGYRVEINL